MDTYCCRILITCIPTLLQPTTGGHSWNRSSIDFSRGMCLPLALELFQSLWPQAGLEMRANRIFPMLGFIIPALNSRAKSCAHCPVQSQVNGILPCSILPEVAVVLVKADPGPPEVILSCVMPQSHSCKDLHSLRVTPWPMT